MSSAKFETPTFYDSVFQWRDQFVFEPDPRSRGAGDAQYIVVAGKHGETDSFREQQMGGFVCVSPGRDGRVGVPVSVVLSRGAQPEDMLRAYVHAAILSGAAAAAAGGGLR